MSFSIVEFLDKHEGYQCGYCKGKESNFSHGMWAHFLAPEDYKGLMDRGWRRSGKYCYKPIMDKTCCPQYTIKCFVPDFKPKKSHKKVLKRFIRYLKSGTHRPNKNEEANEEDSDKDSPAAAGSSSSDGGGNNEAIEQRESEAFREKLGLKNIPNEVKTALQSTSKGPDPSKPRIRKAKAIRAEYKRQRLIERGDSSENPRKRDKNKEKNLEDFLEEIMGLENGEHKFETKLIVASTEDPEFQRSFEESFAVYTKYQISVHGDAPEDCTRKSFKRFLCSPPMDHDHLTEFGGFHQQYLIDGRIFCVGVIDLLPDCLSSVYLYYDPEFSFLSPGTLSSLMEIGFMRSFSRSVYKLSETPNYYYMGFYIHSCPKMRYKAQYSPSFLLCPESYKWVPFEECKLKLDKSEYSAFFQEEEEERKVKKGLPNLDRILVLFKGTAMRYLTYRQLLSDEDKVDSNEDDAVQYAKLVGLELAERMLLYRSNSPS